MQTTAVAWQKGAAKLGDGYCLKEASSALTIRTDNKAIVQIASWLRHGVG